MAGRRPSGSLDPGGNNVGMSGRGVGDGSPLRPGDGGRTDGQGHDARHQPACGDVPDPCIRSHLGINHVLKLLRQHMVVNTWLTTSVLVDRIVRWTNTANGSPDAPSPPAGTRSTASCRASPPGPWPLSLI